MSLRPVSPVRYPSTASTTVDVSTSPAPVASTMSTIFGLLSDVLWKTGQGVRDHTQDVCCRMSSGRQDKDSRTTHRMFVVGRPLEDRTRIQRPHTGCLLSDVLWKTGQGFRDHTQDVCCRTSSGRQDKDTGTTHRMFVVGRPLEDRTRSQGPHTGCLLSDVLWKTGQGFRNHTKDVCCRTSSGRQDKDSGTTHRMFVVRRPLEDRTRIQGPNTGCLLSDVLWKIGQGFRNHTQDVCCWTSSGR